MKPKSVATDCTPEKLGMGAMSGKDYGKYGYPAIEIEIDEDGFPAIFAQIINDYQTDVVGGKNGTESAAVSADTNAAAAGSADTNAAAAAAAAAVADVDADLPPIQPINPNVRSRKLEVQGVAQAIIEEELENGLTPAPKKRLNQKTKQNKSSRKALMIRQMFGQYCEDDEEAAKKQKAGKNSKKAKEAAKKATQAANKKKKAAKEEQKAANTEEKKAANNEEKKAAKEEHKEANKEEKKVANKELKHADAVIITAHGSINEDTGRMDIKARCHLEDGSYKTIGILGMVKKHGYEDGIWKKLFHTLHTQSGKLTKRDMVDLRDKLVANQETLANKEKVAGDESAIDVD